MGGWFKGSEYSNGEVLRGPLDVHKGHADFGVFVFEKFHFGYLKFNILK